MPKNSKPVISVDLKIHLNIHYPKSHFGSILKWLIPLATLAFKILIFYLSLKNP